MSRKGKIALGVVIAVSALGFMAWKLMQPRFRFATRSEVEAVVDPRLLEKLPATKPGRMEKLQELFKSHSADKAPASSDLAAYRAWSTGAFDRNKALIGQTIELYESGPVQPATRSPLALDFPNFSVVKQLIKYCAISSDDDLAHGRYQSAVDKLKVACRLTAAYTNNSQTLIEYLVAIALQAITDASLSKAAQSNTLSSDQLQELLLVAKPFDPGWSAMRNSLVGDFQIYTLPFLPNLLIEGKDAEALGYMQAMAGRGADENRDPLAGQYDAIESAKIASRLAMATLNNVGKPYAKVDHSIDAYRSGLSKSLPQDNFSHLSDGAEKAAKEFWYRVRMNSTPNSLGRSIFGEWALDSTFLMANAKAATEREALRAMMALLLFKKVKGQYPGDLKQLLTARYLQSEPMDFLSGDALRYRPDKGLIYSVGQDLKDDGGKVTPGKRPFASPADDWAYRLP